MKEIKFRIWDNQMKVMGQWNEITVGYIPGMENWCSDVQRGDPPHIHLDKIFTDFSKRGIMMQYTGHKDRNGKEIYDGDILRNDEKGITFLVEWSGRKNGWNFRYPEEAEVVGNKYEDPEILLTFILLTSKEADES